jgi:hypothetical protein
MLTRIDSVPIADGCTFTDVKGRNFVAQASMNLQILQTEWEIEEGKSHQTLSISFYDEYHWPKR